MSRTRIAVLILPHEYDALRSLASDDARFPTDYSTWHKRTSEENSTCMARDEKLIEVVVHPSEFTDYCRSTGQQPSYVMLEALAVKKAAQP